MNIQSLIDAAISVRERAYAPYSQFRVGAAIQIKGRSDFFVGCNVENASYGLTICAERMAVGAAVAAVDLKQFPLETIVVAASPQAAPCGACRQFLAEFGLQTDVYCVDPNQPEKLSKYKISELLPNNFRLL